MKKLNKPFRTPDGPKKFSVYVTTPEKKVVKVNFGDPEMEIKRDDKARRAAFRSRHDCENPGSKWKPRYWACKFWSEKPVSKLLNEQKTIEPDWASDEDIWKRAKDIAAKSTTGDPWALTTYLYKKLGGEITAKEAVVTGDDAQPGIKGAWFAQSVFSRRKKTEAMDSGEETPKPASSDSADQLAQKILIDHPAIPAATMLNALKAEGVELVRKEAQAMIFSDVQFLESWKDDGIGPTKFKVALIQEGLGNFRDAFYYTREAIESGIRAFEGKKCFADHPSKSEEKDRPERSVRDIIGHFENVRIEEREDGAAMLCADLVLMPDKPFEWARGLVRHALNYAKKFADQNFVGFSINASGDAREQTIESFMEENQIPDGARPKLLDAKNQGITAVKVVSKISDAISTDLVTEAGARGEVLELIENERTEIMAKKQKSLIESEMKKPEEMKSEAAPPVEETVETVEQTDDVGQDAKLLLDLIKKYMGDDSEGMDEAADAAAKEAYEAYCEMGLGKDEAMKAAAQAMKLAKHMAAKEMAKETEEKPDEQLEEKPEEEVKESKADIVKLTARISFLERELAKREMAEFLDEKLAESKLGRAETDKIRDLIGEPKNKTEIEKTIKVFKEAFGMAGGESKPSKKVSIFVTETEKQSAGTKPKVNFSDCILK